MAEKLRHCRRPDDDRSLQTHHPHGFAGATQDYDRVYLYARTPTRRWAESTPPHQQVELAGDMRPDNVYVLVVQRCLGKDPHLHPKLGIEVSQAPRCICVYPDLFARLPPAIAVQLPAPSG